MKKVILVLCVILGWVSTMSAQEWSTDFKKAQAEAAKKNLPIVLVFQGSDWCAPCIKLDREVWSTDEFKAYAKDHYIMVQADFPRKKANQLSAEVQKQNNELAAKYNSRGFFPYVVVMDATGKTLGQVGYKHVPAKEYIAILNSFLK